MTEYYIFFYENAASYFPHQMLFQAGLQLGSSHAILVGDPQQLPATIFSMSGRNTKYDRSLFARLEEAGHAVHMLDTQFRMVSSLSFLASSVKES